MPRRSATLAVSILLLVVLAITASRMSVPYAALTPGPTTDTLGSSHGKPLIHIEGRPTFPTSGHLNLTTIQITKSDYRMDLIRALRGWLDPDMAVVPKETFYPEGKTQQQIQQQNAEEMQLSQQHATTAAMRQLGIPVASSVVVGAVVRGTPSVGRLHAGDRILAVDGKRPATKDDVRRTIVTHRPGDLVVFDIERQGKRQRVTVFATLDSDGEPPRRSIVGILPAEQHRYPFPVTIQLDNVAGPSAGLMFALGIVEKLTPEDITSGLFVAGTGSIDDQGKVGRIGGIQMKIIGARKAGAKVFLTPKDNCEEARKVDAGEMRLIRVDTLTDAMSSLRGLRGGAGSVPTC
jgi:Lon-like protease